MFVLISARLWSIHFAMTFPIVTPKAGCGSPMQFIIFIIGFTVGRLVGNMAYAYHNDSLSTAAAKPRK